MQQPEQTLPSQPMSPEARDELARWMAWARIFEEFVQERQAQLAQWGDQPLELGFGGAEFRRLADQFRRECDEANEHGGVTHRHVLLEETYEALAEADYQKARDELIQVGAVVVKVIEDIDRQVAARASA